MTELWSVSPRARRLSLTVEILLVGLWAFLTLASGTSLGWHSLVPATLILAAVITRRFSLPLTAVLSGLGAALQLIGRDWITPLGELGYVPVLYAFGSARDARWRRFGFASALASVVLGPLALLHYGRPEGGHDTLIVQIVTTACMSAMVTFGGWVAGYLRHQQRATVESAVAAQIAEVELERLSAAHDQAALRERIAAEMHDVVGHSWAVVAAQADGARYALASDPARAEQALVVIGDTAREAITDLRGFLQQLRFEEQPEGQIGPEQRDALLNRMRAAGLDLRVHEEGDAPASPLLWLTHHRLLAEALTNTLKHGDLRHPVTVDIDWREGLTMRVENVAAQTSRLPGTGHGIRGMQQRAVLAGGHLTSAPHGERWVVETHVPTPAASSSHQEPS